MGDDVPGDRRQRLPGSHVVRALVEDGEEVRVMVREGANTIGIDDLDVTRFVGDIWDDAACARR